MTALAHTLTGIAPPAPEPPPLRVVEQNNLAVELLRLREHYVARGLIRTTFERAAFHRCVAYDNEVDWLGHASRAAAAE